MVLGHESSGTVISVGSDVRTLKAGDPVCMEPGVPCRRCVRCKEGAYNLCPHMGFAATPPFDGTLARYYVLPEDFCYLLPSGMSLEEGAMMEPLAVAVHIVRQSAIRYGDTVVVFGAGPIGLLCCAVAKSLGARTVVAVDIRPSRLAFATTYAADSSVKLQPDLTAEQNATIIVSADHGLDSGGADIVIDASGAQFAVQTGIHLLHPGGTYIQAGNGPAEIAFPITACVSKELTVRGSFRYGPGDYALAVALVADGKVDVKSLVTDRVGFRDVEAAIGRIADPEFDGVKILIGGSGEGEGSGGDK
jgi:D-xylulose reductase